MTSTDAKDALRIDTIPPNCVVLDTETTGFDPDEGDRLVEIACVRMRDGVPTDERLHLFVNPERLIPDSAVKVHGITTEMVAGEPLFAEVADQIVDFIGDEEMVAHNAGFDAKFINFELKRAGYQGYPLNRFTDSIQIARKKFPGSQANLDALCRRFKISLKDRSVHGALIDTILLAEVCVELMGGRQVSMFDSFEDAGSRDDADTSAALDASLQAGIILRATPDEITAHENEILSKLGPDSVWAKILTPRREEA